MTTSSTLAKAIRVAAEYHDGQLYEDLPYLLHLSQVNALLPKDVGYSVNCIAYLHDILEDTNMTFETLVRLFDTDIATEVETLTRLPTQSYQEYIDDITTGPALMVKLADLTVNRHINYRWGPEYERLNDRYDVAIVIINQRLDNLHTN